MDSLKNNNLRDSDFDSANIRCGIETITPEAAHQKLERLHTRQGCKEPQLQRD